MNQQRGRDKLNAQYFFFSIYAIFFLYLITGIAVIHLLHYFLGVLNYTFTYYILTLL